MRAIGAIVLSMLSFCIPYGPLAWGLVLQRNRWKKAVPLGVLACIIPFGALIGGVIMQVHAYIAGSKKAVAS